MPPNAPPAAKPSRSIFDPFNSSATGHQRADNRLSGRTSWRDSRHKKLREQFSAGACGGRRVSDTVGAGSLDSGKGGRRENGRRRENGGQPGIWESMDSTALSQDNDDARPAKRSKMERADAKATSGADPFAAPRKQDGRILESSRPSSQVQCSPSDLLSPLDPFPESPDAEQLEVDGSARTGVDETAAELARPAAPQIFRHLCFYINGSTGPIGDHKLKHMISTHGGDMSIALGRRTVTHVILGKPRTVGSGGGGGGGGGGGLAGSKMHKEIMQMRGKRVKFITSEWVTESIKAGKRLAESRFEALKLASHGVANISIMFKPIEKA